jgi:hypothetical protein
VRKWIISSRLAAVWQCSLWRCISEARRGSIGEVLSRLARPALGRRLRVQAQVGKNLLDHRRLQDAAMNLELTVSLHRQRLL